MKLIFFQKSYDAVAVEETLRLSLQPNQLKIKISFSQCSAKLDLVLIFFSHTICCLGNYHLRRRQKNRVENVKLYPIYNYGKSLFDSIHKCKVNQNISFLSFLDIIGSFANLRKCRLYILDPSHFATMLTFGLSLLLSILSRKIGLSFLLLPNL